MTAGMITRLGDYGLPWYQLRGRGATLVTTDDTALALATSKGDWDNMPALPSSAGFDSPNCVPAVAVNVAATSGGKIRQCQIIGYGTNAANEDCAWILYAYRSKYSPVIRVAAGTAILGTMDTVKDPVTNTALTGFYVDTWGTTGNYWGAVSEKDNADNACSILQFDARGFVYLYLELNLDGGGNACASFGAAFSGV